ncbi:hypothetical protein JKP88DRAFT_198915 [Tribonema minus]|uniref:Retinol dehydrogenase 12 n=1 Tax=Tribonema minus TaxID=303371 RepID=A0A835Z5W3_9STRA|nr:hypothetical protein JKP88DRAFT_198915 [Tribonema minus]
MASASAFNSLVHPAVFTLFDAPCAVLWSVVSRPLVAAGRLLGVLSTPMLPDVDLTDKVCIVTGSNTGIGKRTALHLARLGGTVILACRSQEKAAAARDEITAEVQAGGRVAKLELMSLDLADTHSVRSFVSDFKAKHDRLDVLVNNAGLNAGGRTKQGLGLVFASNFVGHFLLTKLLQDTITATPGARVVNLASLMHHYGRVDWERACWGNDDWKGFSSYQASKLAMVLFSQELRRRFRRAGGTATSFAVNPGAVRSDIWRFVPPPFKYVYDAVMRAGFLNVEQGAFTSVYAAAAPLDALGGPDGPLYWQPYLLPLGLAHPFEVAGPFVGATAAAPAVPPDHEREGARLWEECTRMVEAAEAAQGGGSGAAGAAAASAR